MKNALFRLQKQHFYRYLRPTFISVSVIEFSSPKPSPRFKVLRFSSSLWRLSSLLKHLINMLTAKFDVKNSTFYSRVLSCSVWSLHQKLEFNFTEVIDGFFNKSTALLCAGRIESLCVMLFNFSLPGLVIWLDICVENNVCNKCLTFSRHVVYRKNFWQEAVYNKGLVRQSGLTVLIQLLFR